MKTAKNEGSFNSVETLLREVKNNTLLAMMTSAERKLNPLGYHISLEAKKRLRWLYVLYHEQNGRVTQASYQLGLSREWLSKIKNKFENGGHNPRKLEPQSRSPHDVSHRKRISKEIDNAKCRCKMSLQRMGFFRKSRVCCKI